MFPENIKTILDELEKEQSYSPIFYTVIQEWLRSNALTNSRDYKTLLNDLDTNLSELYSYKKSLTLVNQRGVEKDVISILENHLEIEITEPEITLKF